MKIILRSWLLLVSLSTTLAANDPDLPLCPTNLQFFPQKLPLHCRMPRNAEPEPSNRVSDLPQYPTLPPLPESYFQSPSPNNQPPPIPIHIPPFPGMPGAMPMPGHMGGPMGGPMAGQMPGMPGAMPMPMPIPMVGGPSHKLPVIVMPFYSQDHSFKKPQPQKPRKRREKKRKQRKNKKKYDSDPESSSCEESESESGDRNSSSDHGFWKGRRKARRKMSRRSNKQHRTNKRKDLLTPILQYVTKDGYVIFEKKISKSEAKDWLKPQTEMTEVKEENHVEKNEQKPEEKRQEENLFNPKSAEDFFKLDEEDQRMKAMEMKEAAEKEVTTRQGKRQHRPLRFNALINKSNES